MFGKKAAKRQRVLLDRVSNLPEFILHMILSVLDTKEACRATVLSKMWYRAWLSIPVLDFRSHYLDSSLRDDDETSYTDDLVLKFVGFVDKIMRRYFEHKIRIRKLHLEFPKFDEKFEHFVDKWIGIAMKNQVQELNIDVGDILTTSSSSYRLREILFSAKSLKILNCENVNLPYYKTMELISLESLTLSPKNVDMEMLQRIISFCPLIDLNIRKARLQHITLPWIGKVQSNGNVSSLRGFYYSGFFEVSLWLWNINVGALRNLRKVEIVGVFITDVAVSQLASGLVALESLILNGCVELRCIKVSSTSLKVFHIIDMSDLKKATIDAPNLVEFWCNCQVKASISLIAVQECNAHFCPWVEHIDTFRSTELKEFLVKTSIFNILVIDFSESTSVEIEVEEEVLKNISTNPPYKLRELKLLETHALFGAESALPAFLDCLFWICHPDVLTITISSQNVSVELVFDILKKKVQCWKHPLESIEVEGAGLCTLPFRPSTVEIRFILSWKSFPSETE